MLADDAGRAQGTYLTEDQLTKLLVDCKSVAFFDAANLWDEMP